MKKTLIAIACALGFGLVSANAAATELTIIDDPYYVGQIIDGIPSSEALEAGYINNLITLAAGAPNYSGFPDDETYNRLGSTLTSPDPLPQALQAGAVKSLDDPQNTGIDVTGFTYILGKYDQDNPGAGAFVWYVAGLASVDLPSGLGGDTASKYGLSHYTLFNPVPDGGATLMLLGGALIGLGALRRRFSA